MKTAKKLLLLTMSVLMLLSCCLVFASAANGISAFSVSAAIGETQVEIAKWEQNGAMYLFLPAGADAADLQVNLTASDAVTLDGKTIADGDRIALTPGGKHTVQCGTQSYTLSVFQGSDIPTMHITTESGSMDAVHADKSHKEKASLVLIDDGEVILEKDLDYIKGRGNATWTLDKKPYNIKFDKKTDLFGMGKAKKWSLLANHLDESLLRNDIALDLADAAGIEFTSKHIFVDLYVNNEYYGNYLLTESVEVGETRVDIRDLEGDTEDINDNDLDSYSAGGDQTTDYKDLKANTQKWLNIPNNPEDITGGYLLEYELPMRYVKEASGFVTNRNQTIVLKAPEYASEAQVKYISALYQEFEDAVFSANGYNAKGKHYTEYIDVESFVKMYVFQEYVKNLDAGLTSFFIYKDTDSDLFYAAPVWDFDNALGNDYSRYGMNTNTSNGWWAGIIYHFNKNDAEYLPTILNVLFSHRDFFDNASAEWNTVFAPMLTTEYFDSVSSTAEALTDSAVMNAVRWDSFSTTAYAATKTKYENYVSSVVLKFMKERKDFLNKGFGETSVRVFFDANGGEGGMFTEKALQTGDIYTVPDCDFENGLLIFDGWNTKADGSGTSYEKGDTFTLGEEDVTLYAQWREITALSVFDRILNFFRDLIEKIRSFFGNLFG